MRIFTTVLAANGNLGWVGFAIAALLCVLASEAVCIVFLVRRIVAAGKKKQRENEKNGTSLSGFAPLIVAAGVIRPVEVWLTVFCALALAGAVGLFVLFLVCYFKGYLFASERNAETKPQDPIPERVSDPLEIWFSDENADRAIPAFAERDGETEEITVSDLFAENEPKNKPEKPIDEEEFAPSDETDDANLSEDDADDEDGEPDGDDNDPDHFTGNERIIGFDEASGCYIVARYRKSFEAKLIQSQPQIKKYYSELKNALLSYKGTKSRVSWTADSFHNGRAQIAKINVKTRILELYLALDPATLEGSVYRGQDVGALKKYEETPFRYKIRTPRKFKWALELIRRVSEEHGLAPIDIDPINYAKQYPFDTIDNLVLRKLVKVTTRLEKPANTFEFDEEKAEEEDGALPTDSEPRSWAYDGDQPIVETEQLAADVIIPEPSETSDETIRIAQIRYTERAGENGEPVTVTERVITDAPLGAVVDDPDVSGQEPEAAAAFAVVGEAELSAKTDPFPETFGEPDGERREKEPELASLFSFDEPTADDLADVTFAKEEKEEPASEPFAKEDPFYADPHYEDVSVEDLPTEKVRESQRDPVPQQKEPPFQGRSYEPFVAEEQPPASASQSSRPAEKKRTNENLAVVDVTLLDINFADGDVVTLEVLRRHGLVLPTATKLKIRASGKMRHALTVVANQFTYDALIAIGEAGGETQFIR